MTEVDRELDPSLLLRNERLTLFRLARSRYANLSGAGAAQAPGRWNRKGQEAIYTSTEVGVPLLERLVHTPKNLIPNNLALLTIEITGDWSYRDGILLDKTKGRILVYTTLAAAQLDFSLNAWQRIDTLGIAVPSVVVPVWNVVLYPAATVFWQHVQLRAVEPFALDERLFPEGTPREP